MRSAPHRIAALASLLLLLSPSIAWAQSYPSKPLRFIVPFAPGGGNDVMARLIGGKLSETVGQQVIIDNRGGAGGAIGSELAAKAPPDGYTILMGHIGTLAINPALYPKLPYDPLKDFEPVCLVATAQNILVVHPSLPARSVKELISIAKAKPGHLNFVSGGTGGAGHLAGELLKSMAGVDMVHIGYKGAGPALTDLVGGQVHLMITNMPAAMPHVKSGRLRALAVTGESRSALMPDLPTIDEAGVPGYELTNWFGVVAPAGTPQPVVMHLNREIVIGLKTREMRDRLAAVGAEPVGSTPSAFAAHIRAEVAKWAKVITAAGIRAN